MIAIELSPLELDPRSRLSRIPPRLDDLRKPSYDEEFDRETILYDLFRSADGSMIVGIGPPLANLADDWRLVLCGNRARPPAYEVDRKFNLRGQEDGTWRFVIDNPLGTD